MHKQECIILDIDMILTDILFRVHNKNPMATQTIDANFVIKERQMKELIETSSVKDPEFVDFFDNEMDYDLASPAKDIDKLFKEIEKYNYTKIVIITHMTENMCEFSKLMFVYRTLIKYFKKEELLNKIVEYNPISMFISKKEFFKEKYNDYHPVLLIDDNIKTIKEFREEWEDIDVLIPERLIWKETILQKFKNINIY